MHRGGNTGRGRGGGVSLEGLLVGYSFASEGEASCISQICRVIKLIKRLTHLTPLLLFRFTLSSQSSLSLSLSLSLCVVFLAIHSFSPLCANYVYTLVHANVTKLRMRVTPVRVFLLSFFLLPACTGATLEWNEHPTFIKLSFITEES